MQSYQQMPTLTLNGPLHQIPLSTAHLTSCASYCPRPGEGKHRTRPVTAQKDDAQSRLAQCGEELTIASPVNSSTTGGRATIDDLSPFLSYHPPKCSTIEDLPCDILGMILELAVSAERRTAAEYLAAMHRPWLVTIPLNSYSVLLRLSAVSKTWRTVLFSLPSLWSQIVFHSQYLDPRVHFGNSFIPHALDRSGQIPLDITIWLPSQHLKPAECTLASLEVLVESSPRWKTLQLYIGSISDPELIMGPLGCISGRIPQLQSLAIAYDDDRDLPSPGILRLFEDAPQLFRLDMSGIAPPSIVLPWSQITELKTRWMELREVLDLITACRNVERWEWPVGDLDVLMPVPTSPHRLELKFLTSLDLDIAAGGVVTCVPSVLSRFSLPQLQRLSLRTMATNGLCCSMKSTEALADLFIDCTDLRSLSLSGVYIRETDLTMVLRSLSRIRILKLSEPKALTHEGYLPLLRLLARQKNTPISIESLLPQLRLLDYTSKNLPSEVLAIATGLLVVRLSTGGYP